MGGCCESFGKVLFFLFNAILWIVGVSFLGIGISVLAPGEIHDVMVELGESQTQTAGALLITVGVISLMISFCGCCGAFKESRLLLSIYIGCLVGILIFEFCSAIVVLAEHSKIRTYLFKKFDAIDDVKKDSPDAAPLKSIQSIFECCGFTQGCQNWDKGLTYGCGCSKVDGKVCFAIKDTKGCKNMDDSSKPIYNRPCFNQTVSYLEKHSYAIGGTAVGITLIEAVGLVVAILYCRNVKDSSYEAY